MNDIKDVHVEAYIDYEDKSELIYVDIAISGIMVCPCAITNEDVDYPFSIEEQLVFTFGKDDSYGAIELEDDIFDLMPYIYDLIVAEIPIKVVKSGKIDYPKGDGWQIMSEKDYEASKSEKIDPRLAVLKNFKFDDKEE